MDLFSLLSLIVFGLIVFYTLRRLQSPTLSQKLEALARRLGVDPEYGSGEGPAADQPWGRSGRAPVGQTAKSDSHSPEPPAHRESPATSPTLSRETFPSRAARRLGVHEANDLRCAVILATVLEKCPGMLPHGDASAQRWRD